MSNSTSSYYPSSDVQRLFECDGDTLSMFSKIQGDFGDLILCSSIDLVRVYRNAETLKGPGDLRIWQEVQVGRVEDFPFEFRIGEMQYFLRLASLFNPKNRTDYGLPQTQTDLP